MSGGAIAGTVIGVLSAVAIIALIYTYVGRLQKNGSVPLAQEDSMAVKHDIHGESPYDDHELDRDLDRL